MEPTDETWFHFWVRFRLMCISTPARHNAVTVSHNRFCISPSLSHTIQPTLVTARLFLRITRCDRGARQCTTTQDERISTLPRPALAAIRIQVSGFGCL